MASGIPSVVAAALLAAGPTLPELVGWDGDPNPASSEKACPFARGGKLVVVSGSSTGANMGSALEAIGLRVGAGPLLLSADHSGPLEPGGGGSFPDGSWRVECEPGKVDFAGVPLLWRKGAFAVDPEWVAGLTPDDASAAETLEVLQALGSGALPGQAEAVGRLSLAKAQAALARGDLQAADSYPHVVPAYSAQLRGWIAAHEKRLAAARRKVPVEAGAARRIGALGKLPELPLTEDAPGLFWRGAELCVRQEGAEAGTMRCHQPASRHWSPAQAYASPFQPGTHVELEYGGHPRLYQTVLRVSRADAGEPEELGEFHAPLLLARDPKGGVAWADAGGDEAAVQTSPGFQAGAAPGTLRFGSGYFADGHTFHGAARGQAWPFEVPGLPAPGCATPPLVSPDGGWAACAVALAADGGPGGAALYVFPLRAVR